MNLHHFNEANSWNPCYLEHIYRRTLCLGWITQRSASFPGASHTSAPFVSIKQKKVGFLSNKYFSRSSVKKLKSRIKALQFSSISQKKEEDRKREKKTTQTTLKWNQTLRVLPLFLAVLVKSERWYCLSLKVLQGRWEQQSFFLPTVCSWYESIIVKT